MSMRTPTRKRASLAIETLIAYGRRAYQQPDSVTPGCALGIALSQLSVADPQPYCLIEMAGEALEDSNFHHEAAAIRKALSS